MSRIFINNVDSYVGSALFKELKSEDEDNPNLFITTLLPGATERPPGLRKVLRREKPRLFRKYLLDCDIVIYDLHTANLAEVDEKLKVIKAAKFEDPKILILLSSVFTWADTPRKQKEEIIQEEPVEVEPPAQDQSKIENPEEVEEPAEPVVRTELVDIPFEDTDYQLREPHVDYLDWRDLENLVLSLNSKENLSCYVLCAGVLYGNGEMHFKEQFKSAWLENPQKLPYMPPGANLVPTIHVSDLARAAKFVIETKPPQQYIFAIDKTPDCRQLALVQAISSGIGSGEIEEVKEATEVNPALLLDLWMTPSPVLAPAGEDEAAPFNWHCLTGIAANVRVLNQEFNDQNNLRPVKVLLKRAPGAASSDYAEKLSQHYNAPLISGELAVDQLKEMLRSNACRNRGYVLNGWTGEVPSAESLFLKENQVPEEEEEEEKKKEEEDGEEGEAPKSKVEDDIFPSNVVVLWNSLQDQGKNYDVHRFFTDNNVEVLDVDASLKDDELLETLRIYIERDGRPYNYLETADSLEEKRLEYVKNLIERNMENRQQDEVKKVASIQELNANREAKAREVFEMIQANEEEVDKYKRTELRQCLMQNILPFLLEGFLEVSKVVPEDPVDYLAEFLYDCSSKINKF